MHNTPHPKKQFNIDEAASLYLEGKPVVAISPLFGVSNVTLMKRLREHGVSIRSHKANQKLQAPRGFKKPIIKIDRKELVELYTNKTPVKTLAKMYSCDPETIRRFLNQEGLELTHRRSHIEWKVANWLKKNNIQYLQNTRKIISPLEIDFYLKEHKIGVELHGLYTHSHFAGKKPQEYHHNKFELAGEADIKLFQFWEPDIENRFSIITSMIGNAVGMSTNRGMARKGVVAAINWRTLSDFCQDNHIQGRPGKNARGLGLFLEGALVAVVGYVEGNKTTIVRFCTLIGNRVVGAFGKLLKAVPGNTIVTYSSNDISTGKLYKTCGFDMVGEKKSDLWYTDYKQLFNRQKFMKKRITEFSTFDPTKTEVWNMMAGGYDAIYKSGTKTWRLER